YRGRLIVNQVIAGGPAESAGLRTNDLVLALDGHPVAGLTPAEMSRPLLGTPGSPVRLTVDRDGRTFDIEVTRAAVEIPHVLPLLFSNRGRLVGSLRLDSFTGKDIADSFESAVRSLEALGATGLILDLRGNDGGNAELIGPLANVFLPEGLPVYTESPLA